MKGKKYLFFTGLGRSGTTFLGDMFSHVGNVDSNHEFIGNREFWLLSWYLSSDSYTIPFLEKQKLEIESKFQHSEWFIDVNSYLQYSTDELRSVFEAEEIFHLVRNPKKVISSIYTRRNDWDIHLVPKSKTEYSRWLEEDRFFQVCWNWQSTISELWNKRVKVLRIEDVLSDYDYLSKTILEPFGFDFSENLWKELKVKKKNKTRGKFYRFAYSKIKEKQFQKNELGEFDQWSEGQKQIYTELCFDLSKKLGY